MSETAETGGQIARPLHVLVPLIREDLKLANEAAKRAGLPYYAAAGAKMLEAKDGKQIPHGEFRAWIERNFKISYAHAHKYMQYAEYNRTEKSSVDDFSSLSDFVRRKTQNKSYNTPQTVRPQPWHEPVKKIIDRVNIDKLREENLKRTEERELERKLALQLIDIGYKALAAKLHPDKGGSREAMSRLNHVRDRLKNAV